MTMFPSPLHPLHPFIWPFGTIENVSTTLYHYSTPSTVSTGLTFLHQNQCLYYHIPLFHSVYSVHCIHCIHCILCPLLTASADLIFCGLKTMTHHHIPLFHCIHWFDLFAQKTMSPNHILLFHCIHSFDLSVPRTMFPPPYTTIPQHQLDPSVWPFYTKDIVPTAIYHYSTMSTTFTGLTFLHQRQCPGHCIPLFLCIHCVHWFDLFVPKTMSPVSYTTISLCLLCTFPTYI